MFHRHQATFRLRSLTQVDTGERWNPWDWECLGLPSAGKVYITVLLAANAPNGDLDYQQLFLNLKYQKRKAKQATVAGHLDSGHRHLSPFTSLLWEAEREPVLSSKAAHLICQRFVCKYNALLTLPPKEYHLYNTSVHQSSNKIVLTLSIVACEINPQKITTYTHQETDPKH